MCSEQNNVEVCQKIAIGSDVLIFFESMGSQT